MGNTTYKTDFGHFLHSLEFSATSVVGDVCRCFRCFIHEPSSATLPFFPLIQTPMFPQFLSTYFHFGPRYCLAKYYRCNPHPIDFSLDLRTSMDYLPPGPLIAKVVQGPRPNDIRSAAWRWQYVDCRRVVKL